MKEKMDEIDEIDEIWAIYRRNLGQNSCWNINLPLKINFGRWIKIWEQSGRWIAILPLESHLGRRINTDVIWAVRSRCMKEGKYHKKIGDLSPIHHRYIINILSPEAIFSKNLRYISPNRYIADILVIFTENISSPIFLHEISCRPLSIHDISRHFPPCSVLARILPFAGTRPDSTIFWYSH